MPSDSSFSVRISSKQLKRGKGDLNLPTEEKDLMAAAFLQKISQVLLGECNEWPIHCSMGCAVELPDTDTFDSLYQRADMALYHVKRSGKNNYAFFVSEMLESKYRYRFSQN